MELNKRVAVITGAASGIGAATARAFAHEGAKVVVADIDGDGATTVASEIDGLAIACDVGDEASVNALVRDAEKHFGPIEVFYSNAGIASGGDPLETAMDVWQSQWDVNVMAHVYAVRAVLPGMLQRGEGYLLHTASMAGILTTPGNIPYAVTKHAVVGLAEWLAITYHEQGIRVSMLAPLGVNTPMLSGGIASSGAVGDVKEPDEVAVMVVNAVRDESFLILTDPVAQTWMERHTGDIERWLNGMRRLSGKIASMPGGTPV
ncbi:MAG: short-chain dehydrogenase [Gammaproteobacteria bacterium]|nr:short-chain dehydrogenase [Gammaproteobacteria bacterium]